MLVALSAVATPSTFADVPIQQPNPNPNPNPPSENGNKFTIQLSSETKTGYSPGGGNTGTTSTDQPMCGYQWVSAAKDMPGAQGWLERWYFADIHGSPGRVDPQATAIMDQFMPQAVAHVADQGDWYTPMCTDWTTPAALNWVASNPFLAWVPKGTLPPAPTLPPKDIAAYVLKSMIVPPLGPAISPTPPSPSIVNLATWAWLPDPGAQELTGQLGGTIVKVNVVPLSMTLTTDAPARSYAFTPSDTCIQHGTTVGIPYGPGATAECGITFRVPNAKGYTVTANVVWAATWTSNQGVGGVLPNTVPIPGSTTTVVKEIESVNG